jgi:hypothetical protein
MRQVIKEIKLQEQRKKAAEREEAKQAREVAAQLRKEIQLSKKGKASNLRRKKLSKQLADTTVHVEVQSVEESRKAISAPTPARSRRERPIKPPKRLQD